MSLVLDPQQMAADPELSAFVTANAGSGKTKTLIDRVARLLLRRVKPEKILCVTYTKAAAAEMQRRLFGLLGGWSVAPDDRLKSALAKLSGEPPEAFDAGRLSDARALFAQALETPGGLKIQTIHAFCEKLLRRFPLEAGISPGFRVMDDAAAAAVAEAARKAVARHALTGRDATAEAYARFSVALDFQAFQDMFRRFEERRGALGEWFEREGGAHGAIAGMWRRLGFAAPAEAEAIEREAMAGLDRGAWREAAAQLSTGGAGDQARAAALRLVADSPDAVLTEALACLFTEKGEGAPATWVAKAAALKTPVGLREALLAEQDRLQAVREQLRAARVGWDTAYALTLASAYLTAYDIEKQASAALDFADLIERTCRLLSSRPAAAWVLYKLDGGIDHILVDEAQDTAPEQWTIVRALSEEFFSGEGRPRDEDPGLPPRSLFVVGDEKQSIYSFQGAAPELLLREFSHQRTRALGVGLKLEQVALDASWRSTDEVLAFVDAVFAPPELTRAVSARGDGEAPAPVTHPAMRGHPGCVDLWPLVREEKGQEREAWDAPLDEEGEGGANKRLARHIACEIADLIKRGDAVFDKELEDGRGAWRAATPGDVLILVRKRGALFEEILRALKHAEIPVAGADRLALSAHIVFDDLLALARHALFPQDELTLAALLRSPFCDVSDDDLYALAHGRGRESLHAVLARRADERPCWREAADFTARIRAEAAARRPFEFYAGVLGACDARGRSMRARLLRRLGREAEDALDEFLAQVLAAEQRGVEDLESLADAFSRLDIVVKRELEGGRPEVRVMTAHGAKGLEAPIVFLPETTAQGANRGSPLLETEDGGFLWCAQVRADCEASAAARALRARKEEDEAARLLYVALTRARDRLVLCGRLPANRKEENLKGWWGSVRQAFEHAAIQPHAREAACGELTVRRYGPDPMTRARPGMAAASAPALPGWAKADPAPEAFARYASPSDLGEPVQALAPSPLASGPGGLGRFRRGELIHRLLQLLPDIAPAERPAAARRLLERERDLAAAQREEMAMAALSVLQDPRFAEVFGDGSRAEVAIAGQAAALPRGLKVSGRIDRLVVLPDRVLVADFKTNRPSPDAIEAADPAYLRQMAIYAAVLADVFPGRRVEAALIWTDGPKLMPVPEFLIARTLAELGREG